MTSTKKNVIFFSLFVAGAVLTLAVATFTQQSQSPESASAALTSCFNQSGCTSQGQTISCENGTRCRCVTVATDPACAINDLPSTRLVVNCSSDASCQPAPTQECAPGTFGPCGVGCPSGQRPQCLVDGTGSTCVQHGACTPATTNTSSSPAPTGNTGGSNPGGSNSASSSSSSSTVAQNPLQPSETSSNVCTSGAGACVGKEFGYVVPGTCQCTQTSGNSCSCVALSSGRNNGVSCSSNSQCSSGNCSGGVCANKPATQPTSQPVALDPYRSLATGLFPKSSSSKTEDSAQRLRDLRLATQRRIVRQTERSADAVVWSLPKQAAQETNPCAGTQGTRNICADSVRAVRCLNGQVDTELQDNYPCVLEARDRYCRADRDVFTVTGVNYRCVYTGSGFEIADAGSTALCRTRYQAICLRDQDLICDTVNPYSNVLDVRTPVSGETANACQGETAIGQCNEDGQLVEWNGSQFACHFYHGESRLEPVSTASYYDSLGISCTLVSYEGNTICATSGNVVGNRCPALGNFYAIRSNVIQLCDTVGSYPYNLFLASPLTVSN